ncbi:MAG TPA: TrmB family transcriptional regulator, partial [Deinococcales bacterium]|nr:TrmB family transcriptional regulator [Deinococcales bacterium]
LEGRANRSVDVRRASARWAVAEAGQEPLLVARDGEAALVAHVTPEDGRWHAVHTHNPLVVRLVEGFALACVDREAASTR